MTNTARQETAAEAYRRTIVETRKALAILGEMVNAHEETFAGEPKSWAYVGDLGHVNEQLANILEAFGDDSISARWLHVLRGGEGDC